MTRAAPVRRQYRHIPPMPWVSGVMGRTRSSSLIWSRSVKPSNVTCFKRADREASLGMPVVPEVSAISTIRSGSASTGRGVGSPSLESPRSSSVMTSRGRALSITQLTSCSPNDSGMGTITAPRSGIASSSATYCHTLGRRTPTTSPSRTPRAASRRWIRRTWFSSCSKVISSPPSQMAGLEPRRAAFDSR